VTSSPPLEGGLPRISATPITLVTSVVAAPPPSGHHSSGEGGSRGQRFPDHGSLNSVVWVGPWLELICFTQASWGPVEPNATGLPSELSHSTPAHHSGILAGAYPPSIAR